MDVVEKAIRNAFEKGNPLDPAFRDKVYRSVLTALERALQSNPEISADAAEKRRASVRAKIDEIESEFLPAVETEDAAATAAPSVDDALRRERAREAGATPPPVSPEPDRRFYVEPRVEEYSGRNAGRASTTPGPAPADAGRSENGAARHRGIEAEYRDVKRRRPWGGLLSAVLVLALLGAAVWWAMTTGLIGPSNVVSTAPEAPAAGPQAERQEPAPLTGSDATQDWVTVFSPDDPTRLSAPAGTQAEVLEDESGKFLRIRSGANGTPVSFDVGQGILERIAGQRAVFNLVARAEEGNPTQISVTCDLGDLGECGRKRYAVGYEKGDFLFDIELPDRSPSAGGTVSVITDIENGGKAIDVYEIRVSVAR